MDKTGEEGDEDDPLIELEFPLPPLVEDPDENVAYIPSPVDLDQIETYTYDLDEEASRFQIQIRLDDGSDRLYVFSTTTFHEKTINDLDEIYLVEAEALKSDE